jgi:hypothetical protein
MFLAVGLDSTIARRGTLSSWLNVGLRSSAPMRLWAGFIFGLLVCTSSYSGTLTGTLIGTNTLNDTNTLVGDITNNGVLIVNKTTTTFSLTNLISGTGSFSYAWRRRLFSRSGKRHNALEGSERLAHGTK